MAQAGVLFSAKTKTKRFFSGFSAAVIALTGLSGAMPLLFSGDAVAATSYSNGFETDTVDWTGSVTRTAETAGMPASTGDFYAVAEAGAFTRYNGYESVFPAGGYTTSIDVYLDMSLATAGADKRFDYSSAINNPAGDHRRDFIFNLGTNKDTSGQWIASVSNNTPGNPAGSSRAIASIDQTGWYTLRANYHDKGSGVLQVAMSIQKVGGATLQTWNLSDASDIIGSTVGGHRYGWFVGQQAAANQLESVAIDNLSLTNNDMTNPTATIKANPDSLGINGVYTKISFKLQDNNKVVGYAINGVQTNVTPSRFSDANNIRVGSRGAVYGQNTIVVQDAVGNTGSVNFILDNVGPTITIKSDSTGSGDVYSKANFKLFDKYKVASFQVNGGTVRNVTPNTFSDANGIAVGANGGVYGINTIKVTDQVGNSSTLSFLLDNVAPVVTVKSDSVGTNGTFSTLNLKLSDEYKVKSFQVNDSAVRNVTPNTFSDANGIAVGANGGVYGPNVFTLIDQAGNKTVYNFILDNVAPKITVKSDSIGDANGYSKINFKLSDQYNVASYQVNGGTVRNVTPNAFSDANGISVGVRGGVNGQNIITLTDVAGNSTDFAFILDNVAPIVTVNAISTTDTTPTITGSVDDANASVSVNVNGQSYDATVSGETWSVDVSNELSVGTYDVMVTAMDAARNSGMDTTTDELVIQGLPVIDNGQTPTSEPSVIPTTPVNNDASPLAAPVVLTATSTSSRSAQSDAVSNNSATDQGQVLGAATTTSLPASSAPTSDDDGEVKAATTTNDEKKIENSSSNFLGLGWWWLPVILAAIAVFLTVGRRINSNEAK